MEQLIEKFPNKNWDWISISNNNCINIIFIKKYYKKVNFDWKLLTINKNIYMEDIFENLDLPWDLNELYNSPNFDFKYVLQYNDFNWNWDCLTSIVDIEIIDKYIHLPWNMKNIFLNKTLKSWFIKKYDYLNKENNVNKEKLIYAFPNHLIHNNLHWSVFDYYFSLIPQNKWYLITTINGHKFPLEFIEKILKYFQTNNINWNSLSNNLNLNIEFIKKFKHQPWNLLSLFNNKLITIDDIINLFNLNEYVFDSHLWYKLTSNKNIDLTFIEKHPEFHWDIHRFGSGINYRKDLTIEFIDSHSQFSWNWEIISQNIHYKEIENNIDRLWYWREVSKNKSINNDFIRRFIDKQWDFEYLTRNIKLSIDVLEKIIYLIQDDKFKVYIWENISAYQDLNIDFIEKYQQNINFSWLSNNYFI